MIDISSPVPKPRASLGGLIGSSLALAIAGQVKQQSQRVLLVVPDTPTALRLEQEVAYLLADDALPVQLLPDWETLPFDQFSPHQDIISQRLETLYGLPELNRGLLIVPVTTLMLRTPPRHWLEQNSLLLKVGDRLNMHHLRQRLEQAGYRAVEQVLEHGEFAARGALLDLFPMGADEPVRIDFFDDEIDTLRPFDPDSQRSRDKIKEVRLLPAREFPTDSAAIEMFRGQYRERFALRNEPESLYHRVSQGQLPAGIEYYFPLFFEQTQTLFDALPDTMLVLAVGDAEPAAQSFWRDINERYEDRRHDMLRPLLAPDELYLKPDALMHELNRWPRLQLSQSTVPEKGERMNAPVQALPELEVEHQKTVPLARLLDFCQSFAGRVLFSVESAGRREALTELLAGSPLKLSPVNSLNEFATGEDKLGLVVGPLTQGFVLGNEFALICEGDLLGGRVIQRRRREKSAALSPDTLIRNLAELSIGQPVVHLDHGVGRYMGLQSLDAGGMKSEYLTLEYAAGDKLYVPVTALHLVGRYSGADDPTLNRLGNDAWAKAKRKAAEKVRDVAAELLDVYARRAAQPGQAIAHDKQAYRQFCDAFPFEETDDQLKAINAVLTDMTQAKAMDRLVCGDVGFGKTEVAMRAAFVAVHGSKQVAVLVPTTLLAQQHYDNFRDRFANWPVKVELISRFKTGKEQDKALEGLADGSIDIVIGTHKLLSQDVRFKDLGLLIVDEEHRFGVRQKDKIKALRADVDILTLTATPIPRTLNMAMGGMRDLSIIATPPAKRLAVKTFVRESDPTVVREAILRELKRGGQVYYLHNEVQTIENSADALRTLVPEARLGIAHGQMRERELEKVMSDFYHQRFNVLLCSTIIETGIDVPSANTIIMDRADKLGLAQLHQLRGRVGRSHHQAYAYLLTPHPKRMTTDAKKRLEAIAALEDLGAGFALATHDLEIRGAGELLGDEQSGQITAIGFSLYMEMLEQAVKALQSGKEPTLDKLLNSQADIELRLPALLPDDYIPDVNMRLSMYKRIAAAENDAALRELQVELIDRFGLLPEPGKNLIALSALKSKASELGIEKIDAGPQGGTINFGQDARVDPGYLVSLLQSQPRIYKMEGPTKLRFAIPSNDAKARLSLVGDMLNEFAAHQA
ncbi:transcription-repair coupling factor [Oceanimonas baumannii]|uniref:Transcription-repair-coupling factor n=1 Tax=Oceanimonas baumannii TaxID=129578 RepID=A0A235CKL0_9GAMM|nr:transcription-repair coupling factor [Oceanimonas baumannii]OYD25138.1 transcription-repair coupling factor [Oceanimonas baumannii]TDW62578.1 transcription-repair coupling factor (superfamily II helicase) [Oceanimonas baumannii]